VSDQLHVPSPLPLGKKPAVHIGYEAGCDPEAVWKLWRREKCPAVAKNLTPVVLPVLIISELSRLLELQEQEAINK
jgi:hypothetical protein